MGCADRQYKGRTGVGFSHAGDLLWIYQPGALNDQACDRLLVVDAAGTALAEAELDTAGQCEPSAPSCVARER